MVMAIDAFYRSYSILLFVFDLLLSFFLAWPRFKLESFELLYNLWLFTCHDSPAVLHVTGINFAIETFKNPKEEKIRSIIIICQLKNDQPIKYSQRENQNSGI